MKATSRSALCLLLLLLLPTCELGEVLQNVADDDDDGWFNEATNQAVTLTLDSAVFPISGNYRFLVDGARFPLSADLEGHATVPMANVNQDFDLGFAVAKRTVGTNLIQFEGSVVPFRSTVRLERLDWYGPVDLGTADLDYSNQPGSFSLTLSGVVLNFSTARESFADPDPQDRAGDGDGDGIREFEEAILCQEFGGLGDPRPGGLDLLMIAGHTQEDMRILERTVELLQTRFRFRGIFLYVDDGQLNGLAGEGGLMTLDGESLAGAADPLTLATGRDVRDQNVAPSLARFGRFVLLGENPVDCGELSGAFGCGEKPGKVVVAQSKLASWIPSWILADIHDFQAKVVMHELGHNLALCHPTENCDSGTLPAAEQDPATTVMGTPAENPPIDFLGLGVPNPQALINALARPLDYSPTQWTNLELASGLAN